MMENSSSKVNIGLMQSVSSLSFSKLQVRFDASRSVSAAQNIEHLLMAYCWLGEDAKYTSDSSPHS